MVLIGLFALLFMWATPASAEPISISLLLAVGATSLAASATAVAVTTFVLTTLVSMALTFVAQALFKPSSNVGASRASSGGSAPTIDNKVTIRQAAAPRQIIYGKTRASGVYGLVHATDDNQYLHLVVMFAGHEIEEYSQIWFNDEIVTLNEFGQVIGGTFDGAAQVNMHLGHPDQAADASLVAASEGAWTSTDRLRGIAYLYVLLRWNAEVFTSGLPNITCVIKGKKDIYDPRDESTGYSANSALCFANYLCDQTYGLPVDYDIGINETSLISAANASDEDVDLPGGGTEKRYETDGIIQSSSQPQEIIGRMLGAMHGRAPYDGEQWKIIAGVYQVPTLTFNDDYLRAGPKIQTLTSRRDVFNAGKGTYVGPLNKWQEADFEPITSAAFQEEDGDQQIFKDYSFPLTSSPYRARRIVKIDLLKARQPITASMPCNLSVWRAQAGDTIGWTSERYGWVDKPFEIGRARFAVDTSSGNPILAVDLDLRETAAALYDETTSAESTVDPAPDTNFPSVFGALPPSNLQASESLYATRNGGGVKAKVTLTWDASPDAFVTSGGGYLVEYRETGTSFWVPLPQTSALTIDILDVAPAVYDFRVFSVNWAGNRSDLAAMIVARPIVGISAPPAAPANLTLVPNGNFAVLRWDAPPDLDVEIGGTIIFKHASQLTGASWADGITISKPLPASLTFAVLPLVAGTYMAKYRDAGGTWSEDFASFATSQDGALEFNGLVDGSLVEDPDFTGVKTNCVAFEGKLKLGGAGLFSDIPLVSDIPSFAYYGGVLTSGTYNWSAPIDLGVKTHGCLTINKTTLLLNIFELISERTGDVSTWPRFGGDVAGTEADARTEWRLTDDDPSGTPTWTEWARVDVGEFNSRGIELRTQLESFDPSFDIEIRALSAIADEIV